MSVLEQHSEWLSLIDVSGPFLAEPVLKSAFPQGLEGLDAEKRKTVRQAYDEWREALDLADLELPQIHDAWIGIVLKRILELDEDDDGDVLKAGDKVSAALRHEIPEHGVTLHPDYAVVDDRADGAARMLVAVYEPGVSLSEPLKADGWSASPSERMVELCRGTGVRLGLVTNGEQWMFVDAPVGAVVSMASWYARLWGQEPVTLQAFVNLFGIRRFFVATDAQLPTLLDESVKFQDEVTDALGEQVRRAVEVLIQALDKADVDRHRELLVGVEPAVLYEAALTVMMRIVFLLSAEERGLLLLGDERYEANYAVSTLRMQLRAESEEILERRGDAWSRLLSIIRAVYGGIDHEAMRLPALGGSLFDPDRFPFLEGRARNSSWKHDAAAPLPIDNRTVLYLLDAVQLFEGRTLSYLALDVEQIGYVYEGLLERTVVRAQDVTLDLDATKSAKNPWVSLPELDDAAAKGREAIEELLKERTSSSVSRVRNDLDKPVDEDAADKLLTACHADRALRDRVRPYFHFLRTDRWGYPLIYPTGAFMVTTGTGRRETGTHYTPKSLTEAVVKETLEPVVYVGPAEGKPREEWQLKSPSELLDLKICDPAMGSGAFLVQVCRWLSERLVDAWQQSEATGGAVTSEGAVVEKRNGHEPLRNDPEERSLTARRLIAERCLYGVDVNPLAVELAKLSIWLITLAKGRPFGFLDHNLRSGDSLLGIRNLEQLLCLEIEPSSQNTRKLFAANIDEAVSEAIALRAELRNRPILDIRDVEAMASLDTSARERLRLPDLIADTLVAEVLAAGKKAIETTSLSIEVGKAIAGDANAVEVMQRRAIEGLSTDLPTVKAVRKPLHWPLAFPEVFCAADGGFDAVVGNPPWGISFSQVEKDYVSRVFPLTGDYESAMAFVQQGVFISHPAATIGLVLSNTLLLNDSAARLRQDISSSLRIRSIINLAEEDIFRGATVKCCAITLINTKPVPESNFSYATRLSDAVRGGQKIPQSVVANRTHWAALERQEEHIPDHLLTIADAFHVKQGYIPYRKSTLQKAFGDEEGERILTEKLWHSDSRLSDEYVKELKGKDVSRFAVAWSGLWVKYGPWVATYLEPEWFRGDRVLVREIVVKGSQTIISARTSEFFVHNPSIITLKPKKEIRGLTSFLAIYLNSDLATKFILQLSSKVSKGFFPKVLVKDLRALPFPDVNLLDEDCLRCAEDLEARLTSDAQLWPEANEFISKAFSGRPAEDRFERSGT